MEQAGGGPRPDAPQAARETGEAGAPTVEPPGAIGYVRSVTESVTSVRALVTPRLHIAMPIIAPRAGDQKRRKSAKASATSEPFGEVTNLCDIKLTDVEWFPSMPAGATLCKACENRRSRAASELHGKRAAGKRPFPFLISARAGPAKAARRRGREQLAPMTAGIRCLDGFVKLTYSAPKLKL